MYDRKIPLDLNCGISIAQEVIISKWKYHILNKINEGIIRPKDLHAAIPEITKRVLLQQLKQLELYQIIHKTIYSEVPLRTEYRLTDEGYKVLRVLKDLNQWGINYRPQLVDICYNNMSADINQKVKRHLITLDVFSVSNKMNHFPTYKSPSYQQAKYCA